MSPHKAFRFCRERVSRHRRLVAAVIAGALLAALFEGSTMGLFAVALDSLVGGTNSLEGVLGLAAGPVDDLQSSLGKEGFFALLVGLAVLAQILRSAFAFGGSVAAAHLQSRLEGDARIAIFDRLVHMPYGRLRARQTGDLAAYLEQVNHLGQMINKGSTLVAQGLLLLAYASILLWLSVSGTLLALLAVVVLAVSMKGLTQRIRTTAAAYKNALVELTAQAVEFLNGMRVIQSFGAEETVAARVNEVVGQGVIARRRGVIWQAALAPLVDILIVVGVGAALILGFLWIGTSNGAALVRLATFLFVLFRLSPRLSVVNKQWGWLNNHVPFVDRIATFLEEPTARQAAAARPATVRGFREPVREVQFRRVSVTYPGRQRPAVSDLTFAVREGEMVALVGASGSGKTTIIDLLLGLIRPSQGAVLVNGLSLGEIDWEDWRRVLGVVGQETFLFSASVRENIAFGRPAATHEEIMEAARAAQAEEFIQGLPSAYETPVGTEGSQLSGGQKQRLAIARALIRRPEILVLDEATSELDAESERFIRQALEEQRGRRILVVVAHRLATIQSADRVLVLADGRIAEKGSHDDLMKLGGEYSQLWSLQNAPSGDLEDSSPIR